MGIAENNDVLEFLVEQIKNNVKFLKSKGRLSADAAQQVDALLSKREASTPFSSAATPEFSPPSHPPSALTAPAPSSTQGTRVRALYDYNNPGDLCFKTGDIIELTPSPDDNEDWWTGRLLVNGQTGLFPSNHVVKIAPPSQPFGVHSTVIQSTYTYGEKPGPAPHVYAPPYQPPGPAYNPPPPPPTSTVIVQQQDTPGPDGKKSKYGKLGDTMANSAAGGVGFGAGAAIGSGLINAIF